ncbi:MAG: hypothetical protein U9Q74_01345 [Gemmatimonadota bacterium]|nr:hypothetical protein [Gemmatimonadota bacterium]
MGVADRAVRLGRAVITVLGEPGALARASAAGVRAPGTGAAGVFLVVVVAFLLTGPIENAIWPGPKPEAATFRLDLGGDSASFVTDPAVQGNVVVRLIGADRAWMLLTRPGLVAVAAAAMFPATLVLLLPFFAALTWLAWRPGRLPYRAHLAFALDLHSAVFATIAASGVAGWARLTVLSVAVAVLAVVYTSWYAWVACRDALGGTTRELVVRTTVVGVLYTPPAIALTALLALRTAG